MEGHDLKGGVATKINIIFFIDIKGAKNYFGGYDYF